MSPFVLAATGDTLVTRRLSTLGEPAFARVVALLRSADAAFTNLETTIHDGAGHPSAQSGGTWMVAPAYAVDELHWAGLRLLARANNHALDWAVEGMRATTRLLDAQGLTHAGVGEDLAAAREPAYRDTPGGRVALVSAASTFPEWSRAGHARKDVRGRPGLNPLRWAKVHLLSPQAFRAMQGIAAEVGIVANDSGKAIHLFDTVFVPWQSTGAGVEAFPQDLAGNLASVRAARAHADWVIVSLHSHEDSGNVHQPAPFAVAFARACIDNGADAVLMHGAHVLRGIELHQGKPILYGLGNFIYHANLVERLPADVFEHFGLPADADDEAAIACFERAAATAGAPAIAGRSPHLYGSGYSVLVQLHFADRALREIRLHPLTLGPERSRALCGYPRLAEGPLAGEIIAMLRELSAPFGTKIDAREGCGIVVT